MAVLPLRIYGDPVLRAKAKPLLEVTDATKPFVLDMFDTMLAEDGVGLAAPQVGASQRLLVLAVPVKRHKRIDMTLINPEVVRAEGWEVGEEGCLSVPGIYDEVKRASSIAVKALDETGKPVEFDAEGYLARAIQHELDHLNGVLFVDRLGMLQKRMHRSELEGAGGGTRAAGRLEARGTGPLGAAPAPCASSSSARPSSRCPRSRRWPGASRSCSPSRSRIARGVAGASSRRRRSRRARSSWACRSCRSSGPIAPAPSARWRSCTPTCSWWSPTARSSRPQLLAVPRLGCINLHASLLPAYRGASPIQAAILDGRAETGNTTMWMAEGLDTGDMILQRELAIGPRRDRGRTVARAWRSTARRCSSRRSSGSRPAPRRARRRTRRRRR